MDLDAKLFVYLAIAQYAIDHGFEVMVEQNDSKTEIKEIVSMSQQEITDNGFVMRVFPSELVYTDEEDEETET